MKSENELKRIQIINQLEVFFQRNFREDLGYDDIKFILRRIEKEIKDHFGDK